MELFGPSPLVWLGVAVAFAVVLTVALAVLGLGPRRSRGSRAVMSRTGGLIGKDGIVTHAIDPVIGAGRVNVGGEDWMARSHGALDVGTQVRVVGADGIVLEVKRA